MFWKKLSPVLGMLLAVCSVSAGSEQSGTVEKKPAKRPNILLIISDDHAVNALGIKGKSINYLPHIDKLAKQGMVFDKSYCCNSICGPSRAAILTGRHSHKNGFVSHEWNRFDGTQPTYANLLKANGYQTGYIGKWHLNTDPVGFDYWDIVTGQGHYYAPDFYGTKGKRRIPGYATDIITDLALDYLQKRDKEKPFMLVVGHKAPHRAWLPALRHLGKTDVSKLKLPETFHDDYANRPEALKQNLMSIGKDMTWASDLKIQVDKVPADLKHFVKSPWPLGDLNRMTPEERATWEKYYEKRTRDLIEGLKPGGRLLDPKARAEWKWRAYMEDYLNTLIAVDESIGKIVDYVDKEGLGEDTLILYCGDQSFFLGEHGWFDKRWVFEESMKMPLVMRWKGHIKPGVASQALVQNIDYAPTFADIAGIDAKEMGFQGTSLKPLFKTGKAPKDWRKSLYYAYYEWPNEHMVARHDAVKTDRYTLAYLPYFKEWMMFDLQKDPNEMRNVVDDPAYKKVAEDMKKLYYETRKVMEVPDNCPGDTKEKIFPKPTW